MRAKEFIIETVDFAQMPPQQIAAVAQDAFARLYPGVKLYSRSTVEGVGLSTQKGGAGAASAFAGGDAVRGEFYITLNAYAESGSMIVVIEDATAGKYKGAATAVIAALFKAGERLYQTEQRELVVNDNANYEAWLVIADRVGAEMMESQLQEAQIPQAIEEFLDSLNPDDCGVEDIGAYRIHFEGFTSDCKSSADYRRNPEAVYQQVYADFIRREGGQRPLIQDMVGNERFPILYSIFRRRKPVTENKTATARQVLAYINQTHHEPFEPNTNMHNAVLAHPRWELVQVPLLNLYIPDQEYDDVDYYDNSPESDPYGRVMTVEPGHAGEISQHLVDQYPIVIDADRYIIDGNHRAWAAKYLLKRDYINAWRPVKQSVTEEPFRGIDISISIDKDDDYVDDDDIVNQTIFVQATSGGKELGHVLFTMEYDSQGLILNPQDLEVDERYRGQGIAQAMYDYVKSQGYRIRRSGQQTDAGRGFWVKHRPNSNVWENNKKNTP